MPKITFKAFALYVICFFCFWLISSFIFINSLEASSRKISIDSFKSEYINNEEGEIVLNLSGFSEDEVIHIKSVFYASNSANYFGFTRIESDWIKNSARITEQAKVNISDWNNTIYSKPDFEDSGFHGAGQYFQKIGFYYFQEASKLSSVKWSDPVIVKINYEPSPTVSKKENIETLSFDELVTDQKESNIITPSDTAAEKETVIPTKDISNISLIQISPTTSDIKGYFFPIENVPVASAHAISTTNTGNKKKKGYSYLFISSSILVLSSSIIAYMKKRSIA